jgi:hypothetical protein
MGRLVHGERNLQSFIRNLLRLIGQTASSRYSDRRSLLQAGPYHLLVDQNQHQEPFHQQVNRAEQLQKKATKKTVLVRLPCGTRYAARTIRNKINSKLDEFLTEFPPHIERRRLFVVSSVTIFASKTQTTTTSKASLVGLTPHKISTARTRERTCTLVRSWMNRKLMTISAQNQLR